MGLPFDLGSPIGDTAAAAAVVAVRVRDLQNTGDDLTIAGGDLVMVGGVDSISQDIRAVLLSFLGEWFLDLDFGTLADGGLLGKGASTDQRRTILRDALLSVLGVTGVQSLTLAYNGATRTLNVSWQVSTGVGLLPGETQVTS